MLPDKLDQGASRRRTAWITAWSHQRGCLRGLRRKRLTPRLTTVLRLRTLNKPRTATRRRPRPTRSSPNGNGHDSSFTYSRDDSYHYGEDSPFEGTSYRSPFTPHSPAGTSYESEEPAAAENGLAGSEVADSDDMADAGLPGHDLPASGLSEGGSASDALPGHDLPASGLGDPAMPDTGFASAAAGFHSPGTNYTDYGSGADYTDHGSAGSYTDHGSGADYTDTAAASYSDPAASPYPAAAPLPAPAPLGVRGHTSE